MDLMGIKRRFLRRKLLTTRADYYEFLASLLRSSGGKLKFAQIFESDAARYANQARGAISAIWLEAYMNNGGNLADTWQGWMPDDEVAIIRVSQSAGGDAIITALQDLARMARLSDKIKSESMMTLAAGLIGIAIACGMTFVFPIAAADQLKSTYDFLPLDAWGSNGKRFLAYAEGIKSYWLLFVLVIGGVLGFIFWAINNLVYPPVREWLDEKFALFRLMRDIRGAMFMTVMSTLTRKRAGVMFTLRQSLEIFLESVRTPWMRWRVKQILDGADETGGIGTSAFDTGMISREIYFFLEDMQKAKGTAEGFEATAAYIESRLLVNIIKRMTVYRWALLITAVVMVMIMFSWLFGVIFEMRGAMSAFLATG